ncbi:MAG: hypothetical protein ACHQIM_00670 [Sphingobacteriales bacterium]
MKLKRTMVISLLMLLGLSAFSQPKKRDTLMWFIGHWVTKTVFKADSNYITGGAVGGNVTINKNGSLTIQSQAGQQLNQQIDKGVGEVDQLESQVKQEFTGTEGFNEFHLYQFSQGAIDSAKAFYFGLKIPDGPPPGGTSDNPTYKQYNAMANYCISQADNYNSIVDFYEAHRHNKHEHYDYTPPPQADYFNCWGCNRPAQKEFDKQVKGYDTIFLQPELGLLQKTNQLLRSLTLLGRTGEETTPTDDLARMISSLFKRSKLHPENNGPCEFLDAYKLESAKVFLANRMVDKAYQLLNDVKKQNNYNSVIPAVKELMVAGRILLEELGTDDYSNGNENARFADCRTLIDKLITKLTDQLTKNHDLSYLADIPLMLSLSAQDQILGGDGGGVLALLTPFTTYTLSLDLNVKANLKDKVTQTAHLQGTATMVLELDTIDCVRIVLSKRENGVFTANLLENTTTYPQCSPTYFGTRTYTMPAPLLTLHFCNKGGADTLSLGTFQPEPFSDGLWRIPCGTMPPENLGINGLDGYFVNPMSTMRKAMDIKANASSYQANLQQMLAQAQKMQSQIQSQMAAGGANSAAAATSIKSVMDMNHSIAPTNLMNVGRLEIPITLNNAALAIDQTVDAKQINTYQQLTQLLDHGFYKIQLKQKKGGE